MKTTEPSTAGLPAMFERFCALSTFWQRANAPADLTAREHAEYLALLRDIPESLRRLAAFAELGTDALMHRAAEARKPAQEWRELAIGETIMVGDEYWHSRDRIWKPTGYAECKVGEADAKYRRKVVSATQPSPDTEKREERAIPVDCGASSESFGIYTDTIP